MKKLLGAALAAFLALASSGAFAAQDYCNGSYSETDASNNASPPNGFPEGQAPSTVNDAARTLAGAGKRAYDRDHGGSWVTVGGTANAITLTYTTAPTAYCQGEIFAFKATAANTSTTTINVNGLGAKNVYKRTTGSAVTALAGGEIQSGDLVAVAYDGTQLQLLGSSSTAYTDATNGGITVSGATLAVNVNDLTAKTTAAVGDSVAIYDLAGTATKKAIIGSFRAGERVYLTSGSGNWTILASTFRVRMWGGGGGGASGYGANGTEGAGGGGGYTEKLFTGQTVGGTLAYAVGAAGTAGTGPGNGGNAGNTTFSTLTANGGTGGTRDGSGNGAPGAGGTASSGDLNITGGNGGATIASVSIGGAAPFNGNQVLGAVSSTVGKTGITPGGGGTSGVSTANGGAGAPGLIIIDY